MPLSTTRISHKLERTSDLTILIFTAHAIRDVEHVIVRELCALSSGMASRHFLLDFTHIESLNCSELSTLISINQKVKYAHGRLTLFNLKDDIFRMFTITCLDTLLEICREDVITTNHTIASVTGTTSKTAM
jgi:anti-anti-sigma factor